MFRSVVWSSLLDYPGEVATVLFTGKCNWKCPYCHNKGLKNEKSIDFESNILPKLKNRFASIQHVVISGGEATQAKDLHKVIKKLYEEDFKIGLHTNGSNPRMLKKVLPYISFVGFDIKGTETLYKEHFLPGKFKSLRFKLVLKSMKMVINSGVTFEFRTTAAPDCLKMEDVSEIAQFLSENNVERYVLQQCRPKGYSKDAMKQLQQVSNAYILTELRGI